MMGVLVKPSTVVPAKEASAQEWISFHKAMKAYGFGKATANAKFLQAWKDRGCEGIGCDANTVELREYAQSQGIVIEGGTWDFVPDMVDDWSDWTTKAFNLGFYTVIAIVVVIIGAVGLLAFNIARDPKTAIGAAVAARTGGKL